MRTSTPSSLRRPAPPQTRSTEALIAYTTTGATARRLARERPAHPILAIAPDIGVARRTALVWGVEPRVARQPRGISRPHR